jgi:hypothetical protein
LVWAVGIKYVLAALSFLKHNFFAFNFLTLLKYHPGPPGYHIFTCLSSHAFGGDCLLLFTFSIALICQARALQEGGE